MKIGSLFDGSGGFPLAASMCGIEPTWAAEVEPYPIAVTTSRFPKMKHLGSVTEVNGAEVEPVDVITFGSPCQDLSVAGKRAGLKHIENGDDETTRSGLFMEAIRIIKEMREATNGVYPRFAVWENVPGAFSSNKGEDFRIVLEEFIKVCEPTAVMPAVPKNGWPYADSYCGDGWSLAYRVFDAQFWGVPQRRRRIYIVVDFRGQCAGKVSFEREGLRGYFETGRTPWKETAGDAENCSGATDREGDCLIAVATQQGGAEISQDGICPTITASAGMSGNNQPWVTYALDQQGGKGGANYAENVMPTLCSDSHGTPHAVAYPADMVLDDQGGQQINVRTDGKAPTLRAEMHGNVPCVMESAGFNYLQGSKARTIGFEMEKAGTLRAGQFGDAVLVKMEVEGFDMYNQQSTGNKSRTLKTPIGGDDLPVVCYSIENHPISFQGQAGAEASLCIGHNVAASLVASKELMVAYPIENHAADSLANIDDRGKVQHLFENHSQDSRYRGPMEVCPMLPAQLGTGGNNQPFVVEGEPVYCLQGNGIDRADTAGCNGKGWKEDTCYTPNTIDRPTVAYGIGNGQANQSFTEELIGALNCMHDQQAVAYTEKVRYIVRRLTPTECARLQGFPDKWGHPDQKEDFTDEEYRFWLDVRNTHATVIGGKEAKEYTKEQMLTWYNKLHTDSAEYKMWGNGIALPCALYIMEGIAEVLAE